MQARNSLARFKKRKSQPTAGSRDRASGHHPAQDDRIPPAEEPFEPGPAPPPPPPPPEARPPPDPMSPLAEAETSEKERKLNTLFWMRVALAVAAGTAATFIFDDIEGEERRWASIMFMIILFGATIIVAKGMKMRLPSSDRKKIVTQAIGSYIFLYLFTWIVTYTLVNLDQVQGGINF